MSMPIHIGPHIHLEKTLTQTFSYFDSEQGKNTSLIQTFLGSPLSYHSKKFYTESLLQASEYLNVNKKRWYVHAPYVINLASQDPIILEKGRNCIQKILDNQRIVNTYNKNNSSTVLHIGTKGPLSQVIQEINDLEIKSKLYLENAAQFSKLGKNMEEIRLLKEGIDSKKVGFCFDTCHTFTNGMCDLRNPEKVIDFFDELSDYGIVDCIIHLNDSKAKYKSGQDLHALVGYGYIWEKSYDSLYVLKDICEEMSYDIILETPSQNINEHELLLLN
jgi:deoxyribonuclease-4